MFGSQRKHCIYKYYYYRSESSQFTYIVGTFVLAVKLCLTCRSTCVQYNILTENEYIARSQRLFCSIRTIFAILMMPIKDTANITLVHVLQQKSVSHELCKTAFSYCLSLLQVYFVVFFLIRASFTKQMLF